MEGPPLPGHISDDMPLLAASELHLYSGSSPRFAAFYRLSALLRQSDWNGQGHLTFQVRQPLGKLGLTMVSGMRFTRMSC